MSRHQEVKDLVDSLEADFAKFYENGNKAAGTRQECRLLKILRKKSELKLQQRKTRLNNLL